MPILFLPLWIREKTKTKNINEQPQKDPPENPIKHTNVVVHDNFLERFDVEAWNNYKMTENEAYQDR